MYIDNDEFGIDEFRDSFDYIYKANTVKVKRTTRSSYNQEYAPGDFLGIKTVPKQNEEEIIEINIMSPAPNKKDLDKDGYNNKGVVEYNGCCSYDINLHHMDTIEFVERNYTYGIKSGEKYKIVMGDEGMYQGQYCFKFFKMVKL